MLIYRHSDIEPKISAEEGRLASESQADLASYLPQTNLSERNFPMSRLGCDSEIARHAS